MAYWYEKDKELYEFEKQCYFRFMEEYNHPELEVKFDFDEQHRFVVLVTIPFQPEPESPWRIFKFLVVYEHDHPGRGSNGLYGGTIKVYPLTKLKPGYHHLINDSAMGLPYICQVYHTDSSKVNGYYLMRRVMRMIVGYCIWEKTGVDVDK